MHIEPFGIEMWMNEFEDHCKYNLAETCVKSMTLGELLDITGKNHRHLKRNQSYEADLWRY